MTEQQKIRIHELVCRSLDETISESECRELEQIVQGSAPARIYFEKCIALNYGIRQIKEVIGDRLEMTLTLEAMADYENRAPTVEVRKVPSEHVAPVRTRTERKSPSKFSFYAAVASSAALILLLVYAHFAPSRTYYASVADQYDPVWAEPSNDLYIRDGVDSQKRFLKKGLVKLQMHDGTFVVLEGPCQFSLENESQVFLIQGKLTAQVPAEVVGFTVRTPSATIVDYGTEFGIVVDQYANTETHVKKGEVELRLGSDPRVFEKSIRLTTSQAGRVSGQVLTTIPASTTQFAYEIPSPFETKVKSLGAAMYLRLPEDRAGSFEDVMGFPDSEIEANPGQPILAGPFLGNGKRAYAFRIEGPESAIRIDNTETLPQSPDGSFSIGYWVRFDRIQEQVVSSNQVLGKGVKGGYRRLITLTGQGRLKHCAYRSPSGAEWRVVTGPEILEAGKWYFVMITRTAGTEDEKRIYLNGKLSKLDIGIKDEKGIGNIGQFRSLRFGGDMDAYAGFSGELAEIVLFPRALSDQEVEELYQASKEF